MDTRTRFLSGSALLAAACMVQPACAQVAAPPGIPSPVPTGGAAPVTSTDATRNAARATNDAGNGLQDIVVTARRQEERLERVPVAVSVLSGKFLESHSVQNFVDLNNYVPGIKIETFSSADQYVIGLRGMRSSLVLPGVDPAVGLYIDEVPYSLPIGAGQQFYDLQSVQALKGPQGTLFGQSTTGGALLFTTTRPTDKFEGSITAGAKFFNGNHGVYGTAVLNLPMSEKVRVRLAVNGIDRQGFIKNEGPFPPIVPVPGIAPNQAGAGDRNDDREINARLTLLLLPLDGVENMTVATYGRLWSNGPGQHWTAYNPNSFIGLVYGQLFGLDVQKIFDDQQAMYRKNFWTVQSAIDSFQRVTTYGVSNITGIELSDDLKLRNIANYRDYRRDQTVDLSGGPLDFIIPPQPLHGHEASEEVQLQGQALDNRLKYTAGLFYFEQIVSLGGGAALLSAPPNDNSARSLARSRAIYAQATYNFTDKLSFTAGGRYTWDHRTAHVDGRSEYVPGTCVLTINGMTPPADERCQLNSKANFGTPTWTFSLNYQADPNTLLYVAQRRGYRSGGTSVYGTTDQTDLPFKPEKVTDVELGLKRDWNLGGDAHLRTNLAAYYSNYKNIIRNISPPGANTSVILLTNASSAHVYGGELETTLMPFRGMNITANLAYVHANFGSYPTAQGDATGHQFANVPRLQITGGIHYTLPDRSNGAITIGGDYFYQSKVWFDDVTQTPGVDGPLDSLRQKGYALLNLRVDWDNIMNSPISGSLYVTNVTAKKYLIGLPQELYAGFGFNSSYVGDPRVFGVEFRYKF